MVNGGSGKSYSLSVVAEEIANLPEEIANNLSVLMFDTMGIFWTMKYPNEREEDLLTQWNLKPKGLERMKIYTPIGYYKKYKEENFPTDGPFAIKPSELSAGDWCNVFEISLTDPMGVLIERAIDRLQEKGQDYEIKDILKEISEDKKTESKIKFATENRFLAAEGWGLFSKEGTPIKEIIDKGKVTILDVSCYTYVAGAWGIKNLVIGLICKKLLTERMMARKIEELRTIEKGYSPFFVYEEEKPEEKMPLVWICLDECLPYNSNIITEKGVMELGKIVELVNKGENIRVLSFNNKSYEYKEVLKGYKIKPRELMEIKTETGNLLKCTPDHPILTKNSYISAISAKELATLLIYPHIKDKKLITARLSGHILGDGYIAKRKVVGFSGKGDNYDLQKIKEDLLVLGFSSSKINTRLTKSIIKDEFGKENKVIGISQEITAAAKAWNFFRNLDLPIGEKVLSNTKIPNWIIKSTNEEKAEFLAALIGSDGYGLSKAKNSKLDFNALRLSFNKIETLEKDAWELAAQICKLFNDLGIKVSSIKKRSGNLRKDGHKTIKILITLSKSIDNTIKFLETVGFRYCKRKEINGKKWLAYLKAYKEKLNKMKELKGSALKLKEMGNYTLNEISNKVGIPYKTMRMWSKIDIKCKFIYDFPSFDEWINERLDKGVLYEKIENIKFTESENLFDITVKDNHNFIADNFIVHNCHESLPREGSTPATDALVQILREGRQPGISLILATQQPGEIHRDVITQSDIVISHRITARRDIEALNNIMQTYLAADIMRYLNELPSLKGSAIILDDTSERIFPMRVRPKFSWHGGEAPTAVPMKRREMVELGL